MPRHPPRDWEMLDLAVRSLRLLGGISCLWALFVTLTITLRFRTERSFGLDMEYPALELAVRIGPYVVGGVGFVVLARFVQRLRVWALVSAIALTTILFVAVAVGWVWLFVFMLDEESLVMTVPVFFGMLFVYAVGHLTYHLTQTFHVLRRIDRQQTGGFEPMFILPLGPAPPPLAPPPPPLASRADGDPHAASAQG